ncbi:MAG: PQQ-like beta-propeller repeat protein [Phycisphaerae bacterium]|nr:PQQ-like beta-propeller repeat protein [Phycisphaerae bacterium]
MQNRNRAIMTAAGCLVLVCASGVLAQDWPQWRGPNRDGKVAGFVAPQTWPDTLAQKWKVTVGPGNATPALVGDRLYVFARQDTDEVILCLNAVDGKEIWRNAYPAPAISGPDASVHSGPRSSPAVAEGKVCTLGVTGVVSCVDAATGKLLWRKDDFPGSWPRFHTSSSPILVDGMCVVQVGGPGNGGIVAYSLATGEAKWKWTDDGAAYASPVVMTVEGTRQVVALTDKLVVGVSLADGKLLWQIPFAATGRAYNAATPIVDGQTVIFTGEGRGTKAVRIEKQGDAFKATDLWSNPDLAPQFNTPVLKDGFLYGLSGRGMLFCINAKTGQTAWTDTTSRGNFGAIVDAGSVLMVLPQKSQLTVFQPNGKAYSEVASIPIAEKQTYATPVVAGKRIFVRDQDAVTLLALE